MPETWTKSSHKDSNHVAGIPDVARILMFIAAAKQILTVWQHMGDSMAFDNTSPQNIAVVSVLGQVIYGVFPCKLQISKKSAPASLMRRFPWT